MITSHFAVRKVRVSQLVGATRWILYLRGKLKRGHTSGGESVINPIIYPVILFIHLDEFNYFREQKEFSHTFYN